MRTFIAIELSAALVDGLRPAMEELRRVPGVRAGQPDGIHLTLHFLGNVEAAPLEELAERLARLAEARPGFQLLARGIGAFPSIRRAAVFYVDVTGPDLPRLIDLQAGVRPALEQTGLPVETRLFRPHLTLGRARRPLTADEHRAVEEWVRHFGASDFGALDVHEIVLIRSELGSGPPRYTALRRFPLGVSGGTIPGEGGMRPGGFEPPHPGP